MEVVELLLVTDRSVFVNTAKVVTLEDASTPETGEATLITFEHSHTITVRGDIDTVAFKLFPSGIR